MNPACSSVTPRQAVLKDASRRAKGRGGLKAILDNDLAWRRGQLQAGTEKRLPAEQRNDMWRAGEGRK